LVGSSYAKRPLEAEQLSATAHIDTITELLRLSFLADHTAAQCNVTTGNL